MSRIAQLVVFPGVCLALILFLAQVPNAKRHPGPRTAGISYLSQLEREIYHLTNDVRQKYRVSTLTWESSLGEVARNHSIDMLSRNFFSHVNPEGRSPHDRIIAGYRFSLSMSGENIWSGTGHESGETNLLARTIVESWLSSPGHRKNLLNPEFTDIGVGVAARGKDVRATQVFVRHPQR